MKHNEKNYLLIRKRIAKRSILPLAVVLTLSVLGGQSVYYQAKDKVMDIFKPEVKQAEAQPVEKLSNKEYLISQLEANFPKAEAFDIYTMLKACENKKLDHNADNTFGNSRGIDRGIFMINSVYHSEVSNECAYNLECGVKEGIRIYKERGFKEWSCGKSLGLTTEYKK